MARLTKPTIKIQFGNAVRQDHNILEAPQVVAQREKSIGKRTYRNIYGELIQTGDVPLVPEVHPLYVSQQNDRNPFLYYLVDKMSEAIAISHEEWQSITRLRGRVKVPLLDEIIIGVIEEKYAGMLFQEPFEVEGQRPGALQQDGETRGKLLDLSVPDPTPPLPPDEVLSMAGSSAASKNGAMSGMALGKSMPKLSAGSAGLAPVFEFVANQSAPSSPGLPPEPINSQNELAVEEILSDPDRVESLIANIDDLKEEGQRILKEKIDELRSKIPSIVTGVEQVASDLDGLV